MTTNPLYARQYEVQRSTLPFLLPLALATVGFFCSEHGLLDAIKKRFEFAITNFIVNLSISEDGFTID